MGSISLYRLPTPLLALLSIASFSHAQQCYIAAYGLVGPVEWTACPGTASSSGGVESCCLSTDDCGEDSICRDSSSSGTNWYQAGCTDSNFDDSLCRNNCVSYSTTFIQWLPANQQWMCCGNGGCNGTETDDTFSAVSLANWKAIAGSSEPTLSATTSTTSSSGPADETSMSTSSAPTSTSSFALSSSTPLASSAAAETSKQSRTRVKESTTNFAPIGAQTYESTGTAASASGGATVGTAIASPEQSSSNSSQGLSTGAKAGIGVAVAVAVIALVVATVAIVMLRRKRKSQDTIFEKRMDERNSGSSVVPPPYQQVVEIGETQPAGELPASNAIYEIDCNARNSKAYGGMR